MNDGMDGRRAVWFTPCAESCRALGRSTELSHEHAVKQFILEIDWDSPAAIVKSNVESRAHDVLLSPSNRELVPYLPHLRAIAEPANPYTQLLVWEVEAHLHGHAVVNLEVLESAEALLAQRGDTHGVGVAKALLGLRFLVVGEIEKVGPTLEQSRQLLGSDSPHLEALLANMSWTPYAEGDLRSSLLLAEQALSQATIRGNAYGEGVAWSHIGWFAVWAGDVVKAESAFTHSLAALNHDDLYMETALSIGGLGIVHALRGEFDDADQKFEAAFATARAQGELGGWLEASLTAMRSDLFAYEQPARSLAEARAVQKQLTELGDDWWARWALRAAAQALKASGHRDAARHILEELVDAEPHVLERAHAMQTLGDLLLETDPVLGERHLRTALQNYQASGANRRVVETIVSLLRVRPTDSRSLRAIAVRASSPDPAYEFAWRGGTRLSVSMLGTTSASLDSRPIRFPTLQAEEAFYAILSQPNLSMNVETLAYHMWPDAPPHKVGQRTNTLVWQLRKCLGRGGERIQRQRNVLTLNIGDAECDLRQILRTEGGFTNTPRDGAAASLSERDLDALRRPIAPRFSSREWAIELQHRVDALLATRPPGL